MTTSRSRDPEPGRRSQSPGASGRRGQPADPDTTDGRDHPSYLALDRAALGSLTAQLGRHLADCARCRAHVDRIADPGPAPQLTGAGARLRRETAVRRSARRPLPRRAWLGGLCAAAVAVLLLVGRDRPGEPVADRRGTRAGAGPAPAAGRDTGFDTAKGARAVGVYVRRGRHIFLWNGSEPVQPGDMLRLKLVPDGMTQVHVFSEGGAAPGATDGLSLLHRAAVAPDRDSLLDAAWRVDGTGERELLIVVLSRRPLPVAAARAAARAAGMGDDVWVARLVLAKRPGADPRGTPADDRPQPGTEVSP